jgi:two-component system sensor histidine kinase MprB
MSLRNKLTIGLVSIVAIVTMTTSVAAYLSTAHRLRAGVDNSLRTYAEQLAVGEGGPRRGPGGERDGRCFIGRSLRVDFARILSADGAMTTCVDSEIQLPDISTVSFSLTTGPAADREAGAGNNPTRGGEGFGEEARYSTLDVAGRQLRVIEMQTPAGGVVQLGIDLREVTDVLAKTALTLLFATLAGLVLAGLLGRFLALRILGPVEALRRSTEAITETQDLSLPIPTSGTDEVGSLAKSFAAMVQSLAVSKDQQQRLISDASHEMRTPLTSLRTNLELLERAPNISASDREEVLADLRFEVSELTQLLTEMVELATNESSDSEPLEVVDVAELAQEVADRWQRRTSIPVVVRVDFSEAVPMRRHMIERALSNLLDNAGKYGLGDPSLDAAPLVVDVSGRTLLVIDHGPGVRPEDMPKIFDRFFRATEFRTRPGSGLGLSIFEQIAKLHSAKVIASNNVDGTSGLTIGLEFREGSPSPHPVH